MDTGLTRRETVPLDGIRRVVADRMWESLQRTAQLTLTMEADATALVDLRGHLVPAVKVYGHRPPTYTDLLVYLVARVLPRHPLLNSSLVGEGSGREIAVWQEINVGVAVALERGLVVPVIKGADQKPLQAISQELAGGAERARAGRLEMGDLDGGTFTITNLGQMEVEYFTPIINPPRRRSSAWDGSSRSRLWWGTRWWPARCCPSRSPSTTASWTGPRRALSCATSSTPSRRRL